MAILLEIIIIFGLVLLYNYIFKYRKLVKKKELKTNLLENEATVRYLVTVYKIDFNKLNNKKFVVLTCFVDSIVITSGYISFALLDSISIIFRIILILVIVIILINALYYLVSRFYKKGEKS